MRWYPWLVALTAFSIFGSPDGEEADFARAREEMVATQIASRGVRDEKTLAAMRSVPRHEFVPRGEPPRGVRRPPGTDRPRADDLAAVHRRVHDRGALPARRRARARGRHRLGLPGGRARAHRRAGLLDRDRGAPRGGVGRAPAPARLRQRPRARGRRVPGLARGGAVRRGDRDRRGAAHPRAAEAAAARRRAGSSSRWARSGRSSSSSPAAASASRSAACCRSALCR